MRRARRRWISSAGTRCRKWARSSTRCCSPGSGGRRLDSCVELCVTFPGRRDAMRLGKSILCGAAALGCATGSALADESTSSSMEMAGGPLVIYEETYVIADPSFDGQVAWNDSPSADVTYYVYDV